MLSDSHLALQLYQRLHDRARAIALLQYSPYEVPAERCRFKERKRNAYPTCEPQAAETTRSTLLENFVHGLCPLRKPEGLQDLVLCVHHHEWPILRYLPFLVLRMFDVMVTDGPIAS